MKKISIIIMLVLAGVFAQAQSVWDGSRQLWTSGTGTQDDPFLIESAANLAFLSYMVGKGFDTQGMYFKLTKDIDLNGSEDQPWIPIGMSDDAYYEDGCERYCAPVSVSDKTSLAFKGHFDGGDHSISNIYVNREHGYAGLFGVLCDSGDPDHPTVVENVYVTSGFVKGKSSGGIVGNCSASTGECVVSRCWNGADIEGSESSGGIVGYKAGKIHNCYNIGTINGHKAAGGIVGTSVVEMRECYNNGAVSGDCFSGGVMGGAIRGNSDVKNCYNTGSVSSTGTAAPANLPGSMVGGIVGIMMQGNNVISNCYNVGSVACEMSEPGGALGTLGYNSIAENLYFLNTCGGIGEGETMDAESMRDPLFVEILNQVDPVWSADTLNNNNGYPILGANNLAVNEYAMSALTVYPNPANGQFTVEGTGILRVFNLLGQVVLTQEINERTVMELPRGMYFIRLDHVNGVKTAKLVVR